MFYISRTSHCNEYRCTYLRADLVTIAGKFDVLKVCWESNQKEQVEDLYVSLPPPHPPLLFEEELRKERGSRGSRRWFLSEADSREL